MYSGLAVSFFPTLIASVFVFGVLIAALLLAIKSQEKAIRQRGGGGWDEKHTPK